MAPAKRLMLRLPEDLHAWLVERAEADERSLNSQIVFLLRQAQFPPIEADAYRDTRHRLASMPRHTFGR
jgi:hypothetical protein